MTVAQNAFIAGLPRADRLRLLAGCEAVRLVRSTHVAGPEALPAAVLFPVDGYVSELQPLAGHAGLEIGMVGFEGMVGGTWALGLPPSPVRTLVHGGGSAWRLDAARFCRELQASDALRRRVQRYVYATHVQRGTAVACCNFHGLAERLARWLLMCHDRAPVDEMRVTHGTIGLMLGVRREGVTVAAGELQTAGLIRYHRGALTVRDRPGLEARACPCYAADRAAYREQLGAPLRAAQATRVVPEIL